MIEHSEEIMNCFNAPQFIYVGGTYDIIGQSTDLSIGEAVILYFNVNRAKHYASSIIAEAKFSAMGSVVLIAAAEKLCSLVVGKSFADALQYCDVNSGLVQILQAQENVHSINFVITAFYNAFENLSQLTMLG